MQWFGGIKRKHQQLILLIVSSRLSEGAGHRNWLAHSHGEKNDSANRQRENNQVLCKILYISSQLNVRLELSSCSLNLPLNQGERETWRASAASYKLLVNAIYLHHFFVKAQNSSFQRTHITHVQVTAEPFLWESPTNFSFFHSSSLSFDQIITFIQCVTSLSSSVCSARWMPHHIKAATIASFHQVNPIIIKKKSVSPSQCVFLFSTKLNMAQPCEKKKCLYPPIPTLHAHTHHPCYSLCCNWFKKNLNVDDSPKNYT